MKLSCRYFNYIFSYLTSTFAEIKRKYLLELSKRNLPPRFPTFEMVVRYLLIYFANALPGCIIFMLMI